MKQLQAKPDRIKSLEAEVERLRLRLEEAEQTLDAIRSGQIDSLLVEGPDGPRVYALEGESMTYRILIEAMSEGAASISESGTVVYCNGRLAALLGLPLQQVMGCQLRDHVPSRVRGDFDALLEAGHGQEAHRELALVDAKGEEVPVYFSVSAISSEGRRILCLVAVDLRPKRRTEQHLAAETARRRAAEKASHFAQLFMGILGHDLRNPLTAMVTGAMYLSDAAHNETMRRVAERILASGERMSRMIEQLLDLTRLGIGGGVQLDLRDAVLADITQSLVDEIALGHTDRRIRCEAFGDTSGRWDPDRLGQAISNLVGNAVRHGSPDAPVSIAVTGLGAELSVAVHNAGVIDESLLPTIFEAFTRPRHAGSSGLGLGLYISDQIVRIHGGRIDVSSSREDGTTFVIRLPRYASPSTERGSIRP